MRWTPNKHKQCKCDMIPPTNNWRQRRAEHRFYVEIVKELRTWTHDRTTQTKISKYTHVRS